MSMDGWKMYGTDWKILTKSLPLWGTLKKTTPAVFLAIEFTLLFLLNEDCKSICLTSRPEKQFQSDFVTYCNI